MAVQWLVLHAPNAGGKGSIPGCGIKILHAKQHRGKKKANKSGNVLHILAMCSMSAAAQQHDYEYLVMKTDVRRSVALSMCLPRA